MEDKCAGLFWLDHDTEIPEKQYCIVCFLRCKYKKKLPTKIRLFANFVSSCVYNNINKSEASSASEAVEVPEARGATSAVQPHLATYFSDSSSGPLSEACKAITDSIVRFIYKDMHSD